MDTRTRTYTHVTNTRPFAYHAHNTKQNAQTPHPHTSMAFHSLDTRVASQSRTSDA